MRITDGDADSKLMDYDADQDEVTMDSEDDTDWLDLAKNCYDTAIDYVQS
jgi:hypothetical protein